MDDFDYSQFPDFPELFPELSGEQVAYVAEVLQDAVGAGVPA